MPIDYSKFDLIDDSDEEEPGKTSSVTRSATKPTEAPRASVPARGALPPSQSLEPVRLDERLRIVGSGTEPGANSPWPGLANPDFDNFARQLESWAAPEAMQSKPPSQEDPNEPKRVCMKSDGRKKVHTTFPNGSEMVEEFDERTDMLLSRKTRAAASALGKEAAWEIEVGQAPESNFDPHSDFVRPSSSNPVFLRKDTPEHLQWRIRNLPYPADVYSVAVDHDKQEIVIRTSNKKYYKRIQVPDLVRVGIKLRDDMLTWKHQHNTLVISYLRPEEVAAAERRALELAERSALKL